MKRFAQSSMECKSVTRVLMPPSAVFRPLAENWCISKSDVNKVHFEWNIQHFALLDENQIYKSNEFQGKEDPSAMKWVLQLFISNGKVVVELPYYKLSKISTKYRVKIAILNQRRDKVAPQENIKPSSHSLMVIELDENQDIEDYFDDDPNYSSYYSYEISEQLAHDSLLLDGSLTVYCEIEKRINKNSESHNEDIAIGANCVQSINCIDQFDTRLERLFEDMKFCDVTLSIRGRQFQAHKCILASSSKVFSAMFEHLTKENITGEVVIEDIEPEVFHELLRFIYTSRLSTSTTMDAMAARLLVAADKYMLAQLKSDCEIHLLRRMSPDNCVELLMLVSDQIHPADNLKKAAIDLFWRFPRKIMATGGWKRAKQEHPNNPVMSLILDHEEGVPSLV